MMKLNPYKKVLDIFAARKIGYCILRDDPDQLSHMDEVDILIFNADIKIVKNIFKTENWVLYDSNFYFPFKSSFVTFIDGRLFKFDVHWEFVQGPYLYYPKDMVVQDIVKDKNGYYVLSPEDWFIHVVLHVILGKKFLSGKYYGKIKKKSDEIDWGIIRKKANSIGLQDFFDSLKKDSVEENLKREEYVKKTRKKIIYLICLKNPENIFRAIMLKTKWLFTAWYHRKGFIIAFIGPDGCGKTTSIKAFEKIFKTMDIPVRQFYLGPWQYPILPTTKFNEWLGANPLDKIENTERGKPFLLRINKWCKGIVKRYMYYLNIFLEMWSRYLILVLPRLIKRRVVLADRYIYDLEVGFSNKVINNNKVLRRLICSFFPKPEFTILLKNKPEIIYSRKKEYPLEVIQSALNSYLLLARKRNFTVLHTDSNPEEMVVNFFNHNWKKIFGKWSS